MMKREKRLLINAVILAFGTVLPKLATFLILPIVTSALTKLEYGTYDLILTSLSLVIPVFSLLIEQGVFRFLLDAHTNEERKKIISNSFIYIIISSFILCCLSLMILHYFKIEYSIIISLYIVINLYYRYAIQICRGMGLLKKYSISSVINSLLNLLLILIFVGQISQGLYGLLLALTISIFIATVYAIVSSGVVRSFSMRLFDLQYLKELLKYSLPLLPNSLSWWVVGVSDRWIITAFLGVEATAIYAIANKIPSMFNLIYNNFNLAWQESATITSRDNDANDYYTKIFNHLIDFLVGFLFILIALSPFLFKLFIHESYYLAYYQMPIIFVAMFFNCLAAYYGGIYVALKKTKSIGISSIIAAILSISINLLLISKIGLYAASFSTLISYFSLVLYRAIDLQKYIQISYNLKRIVFLLGILTVISVINYLNIHSLNIINFVLAVSVAIILNQVKVKQLILKLMVKFK